MRINTIKTLFLLSMIAFAVSIVVSKTGYSGQSIYFTIGTLLLTLAMVAKRQRTRITHKWHPTED